MLSEEFIAALTSNERMELLKEISHPTIEELEEDVIKISKSLNFFGIQTEIRIQYNMIELFTFVFIDGNQYGQKTEFLIGETRKKEHVREKMQPVIDEFRFLQEQKERDMKIKPELTDALMDINKVIPEFISIEKEISACQIN